MGHWFTSRVAVSAIATADVLTAGEDADAAGVPRAGEDAVEIVEARIDEVRVARRRSYGRRRGATRTPPG